MVEGDKWEMYIPSELGYGDSGSPPKIPGGAPLVFQMEILKINGPTVAADKCDPATKKGCSEREVSYVDNCVEINPVCRVPDISSLSHFSAMTRPSWLRRAARNRHRHAIEQASRRWRGGRDDSADERAVKF